MADPEIKIKMTREGVDQAANDLKKVEKASADLEKGTEKLTRGKNRLVDAFKKLKQEVPLAGAAIDTFKNPIAAVTIAAAAAAKAVTDYVEAIQAVATNEAVASRLEKLPLSFFENAAKARAGSAAFREELKLLQTQLETTEQYLKRVNDETKRMFPDNERAQGAAGVLNLGNARRREQNAAQDALSKLPGAEAAALAAQNALDTEAAKVARQNKLASARAGTLEGKLATVTERLDNGGLPANPFAAAGASVLNAFQRVRGKPLFFPGPDVLERKQGNIVDEIGGIQREIDQRNATLVGPSENARRAQAEVERLRGIATRGTAGAQKFGLEERNAANEFDAGTAAGLPRIGPRQNAFVQRRFDALSELLTSNEEADRRTLELLNKLIRENQTYKKAIEQLQQSSQ